MLSVSRNIFYANIPSKKKNHDRNAWRLNRSPSCSKEIQHCRSELSACPHSLPAQTQVAKAVQGILHWKMWPMVVALNILSGAENRTFLELNWEFGAFSVPLHSELTSDPTSASMPYLRQSSFSCFSITVRGGMMMVVEPISKVSRIVVKMWKKFIVGKKRDHRILDPLFFSGKIWKNRKNSEK